MKSLFELINVSSSEKDALGAYVEISNEEWVGCESCDLIYSALESIGVYACDFDNYHESVDVVLNALKNTYDGDSVFIWIDSE